MARTYPAVTVVGAIDASALPGLEARLCSALATGACVVTYDLARVEGAHLCAVDALARLQLAARRRGAEIRLRGVRAELAGLLDLAGLGELVQR